MKRELDLNKNGMVSLAELEKSGKQALARRWTRELCLSAVEKPVTRGEQVSQRVLTFLDYSGTALFAVVGTQLAGEKDMNLIGCTLVGCIAAMGGGTLNNLLYGSSALLLDKPGVFWVRVPTYLVVSLVASVATFYAWPVLCREFAKQELELFIGKEKLNPLDGSCSEAVFLEACRDKPDFRKSIAVALRMDDSASPQQLFAAANMDHTGKISLTEMEALVAKQFDTSPIMYALDTAALSAFAVVAVHGAVQRGLHPLVAASSGVTICFGGILRDVLCGRELAIGGQSYAFATGAGATVYVLLRELRLFTGWCSIPLITRIVAGLATTMGLRAWEYYRGTPLLRPMHHHGDPVLLHHMLKHQSTQEWLGPGSGRRDIT